MHRGGGLFDALGTPLGGMVVRVSGLDAQAQPCRRVGTLPQTTTMAPEIPAWLPSLLARQLAEGRQRLQGFDQHRPAPLNAFAPEFANKHADRRCRRKRLALNNAWPTKTDLSMPARADLAFDAFHYHHWRGQWDSLVSRTQVQHGAPLFPAWRHFRKHRAGALRALSMRTQFVSYHRPTLAAARDDRARRSVHAMAASMRHQPDGPDRSLLISYTFDVARYACAGSLSHLYAGYSNARPRQRFARLAQFLAVHAQRLPRGSASNPLRPCVERATQTAHRP